MKITQKVQKILKNYESDNPGTKANIARLLGHGRLGGTGKMMIYPVDQGFEHGPARSFAMNEPAFDPCYHHKLAIDAGCSAYAAPVGMIEACADRYAGQIPLILKINNANSLYKKKENPNQAVTATVRDAVRLGCSAVGYTIYPGSDEILGMLSHLRDIAEEAKAFGLAVVVWSYPRGASLSKEGQQAIDVVAYGAHMACLMGAHVVKVKLPTAHVEQEEARKIFSDKKIPIATLDDRVRHIVKSCFDGRRLVVFSGGAAKGEENVLEDAKAIHAGGGNGSIVGRNVFQRPREDALSLMSKVVDIYKTKP